MEKKVSMIKIAALITNAQKEGKIEKQTQNRKLHTESNNP